jgi:hypothetical protein
MALPANLYRIFFGFALAVAGTTAQSAQPLSQATPSGGFSGVVQFGTPRDAKFVFCNEGECPERSIKHLYVPPPQPRPLPPLAKPLVQEPEVPAPQATKSTKKLSHAKAPAKKKRKKPAVQIECTPVTSTK